MRRGLKMMAGGRRARLGVLEVVGIRVKKGRK